MDDREQPRVENHDTLAGEREEVQQKLGSCIQTTELAERKKPYRVQGQAIQKSVGGVVIKCPHKDKDGVQCVGVIHTIKDELSKDGINRVTWHPAQYQAFLNGGQIFVKCGMCGSEMFVTKPLLVAPNQGPNRHMRRAAPKLGIAK